MDSRARILAIGPVTTVDPSAEVVSVPDWAAAADRLAVESFVAVLADPTTVARALAVYHRDELVLAHLDKGVAVLDRAGVVTWANPAMTELCGLDPVGRSLLNGLAARTLAADAGDPFLAAGRGDVVTFRLFRPTFQHLPYLDITLRPVAQPGGLVSQVVAIARNVTAEVEQQRKLDALHQAGRELADLDPDQLAEMNLPTRVELLKQNLRRYIRDLLHYDIIEVRLLDRRTGELRPLLEDGMTTEAAHRVLFAKATGNGVTGHVAASGESYLCPDTATDPLYIRGASDARSSMTVPLKYHDEVVGTLNVESPRSNGFGADDLQFTELFSKEIATALHTLDLLTAQQSCTAVQSLDLVGKEIAIPVDDVLASAAVLLARFEDDPTVAAHLRRILAGARTVKASIAKVARDLDVTRDPGPTAACPLVGKRVLVVDADAHIRKQAHLMLSRLGAMVETAATATEGIALLTDAAYDAVLMDIKPPDLGGYETYRRLRAARPTATVSMTTGFGYDSGHAIVKARADGMQYVLFKPFRQEQIVRAVLDGNFTPHAIPVTGPVG